MPVRAIHLLTQGKLNSISGGYIYNRELVNTLEQRGFTITVHDIRSTSAMQQALLELNTGTCVIVDSIIAENFAAAYDHAQRSLCVVYLCHLPMGLCPALTANESGRLSKLEHKIIEHAKLVVCTSMFTRNWLAKLANKASYLVVLPAVSSAFIPSKNKSESEYVRLLCVANILQAKGQLTVIQALCASTSRSWKLHLVAGNDVCDAAYLAQIQQTIQANKLENQVSMTFNCAGSELLHEYQQADAFVLATHFETYGMALAEARACALPTIVNDVGGVRESTYAPSTIYVNPKSAQCFQQALQRLLTASGPLKAMRQHALSGRCLNNVPASPPQPFPHQGGKGAKTDTKPLTADTVHDWDAGIESLQKALLC